MKFILLCTLVLALGSLNAQNLVPNSSFEEYSSCPSHYNQLERAIPWFRPTEATSDFFNACDTVHVEGLITAGVPYNLMGYQEAHSGQGYAGICLNTYNNSYREYLEVKLTEPLLPGIKYNVSFYYVAADSAKMAVKSLGAFFTPDSLLQSGYHNFPVTPQVNYNGDFISDTSHWRLFSKSFIATGGENYLVLGNFKDQSQTDLIHWSSITTPSFDIAYIYVDDISVSEDTSAIYEDTTVTEDTSVISENIPDITTAGSDLFYISPNLTMGEVLVFYDPQNQDSEIEFRVFNLFGHEMSRSKLHAGTTVLQTGNWSAGYYFFQARNGHLKKEGKFLLVK